MSRSNWRGSRQNAKRFQSLTSMNFMVVVHPANYLPNLPHISLIGFTVT
jgi:hypothetical protein